MFDGTKRKRRSGSVVNSGERKMLFNSGKNGLPNVFARRYDQGVVTIVKARLSAAVYVTP